MASIPRTRLVNPRLGTYFGIFASAFAALFFLLLIFEQLGASDKLLRAAMFFGPLGLYLAIGLSCPAREPSEYFASGRRVPAVYNGLSLAMTAMGGTGLLAMTGTFFLLGFDALWLMLGGLGGFVVMAVLLAPFLRKFGAFTVPSYLGHRFDSRALRLVAAATVTIPMLLMLGAELKIGAWAAAMLVDAPHGVVMAGLALVIAGAVAWGGMRALTWAGVAKLIAALLALMAPVATVAVLFTSLPLPQLTTGPLLRSLVRREVSEGLSNGVPGSLSLYLPGQGWELMEKPFASAFGSAGAGAFTIATFTVLAGVASAPWLLPRLTTSASIHDARKSLGWATFCFGVVALTLAAVAIFMRDFVIDYVSAGGPQPAWLGSLEALGFVMRTPQEGQLNATSIAFLRDAVLLSLPTAARMPDVLFYVAVAGVIALSLAAAAAVTLSLGNVFAEDVAKGLAADPRPGDASLSTTRGAFAVALLLGLALALLVPGDPLAMMLWAFALSGAGLLPVLVLSIWWKSLNRYGAIAGMATGFAVTALTILASESHLIGLNSVLAAAVAIPAAAAAIIVVTRITPAPGRTELELVRNVRIPGGEVLYDREVRLARLKQWPPR